MLQIHECLNETIWGSYLAYDNSTFHAGLSLINSEYQGIYLKAPSDYGQFELNQNKNI